MNSKIDQRKIKFSEICVYIYPTIAERILQAKQEKPYMCWLIAHALDNIIGDNSGKVSYKKLINKLINITNLSYSSILKYLKDGEKIFWNINLRENEIYLVGFNKLCINLNIEYLDKYAIECNLDLFQTPLKNLRPLLTAIVASKTTMPVSIINLSERLGFSKNSIRNYIKRSEEIKILKKINNFKYITSVVDKMDNIKDNSMFIKYYKGNAILLKQLPNSFHLKLPSKTFKTKKKRANKHLVSHGWIKYNYLYGANGKFREAALLSVARNPLEMPKEYIRVFI